MCESMVVELQEPLLNPHIERSLGARQRWCYPLGSHHLLHEATPLLLLARQEWRYESHRWHVQETPLRRVLRRCRGPSERSCGVRTASNFIFMIPLQRDENVMRP